MLEVIVMSWFSWWQSWFRPVVVVPSRESLLEMHNAERLRPLEIHPQLVVAARRQAEWMASRGRLSHRGEGLSTPGDRMRDAGYSPREWGENVAYAASEAEVFRIWMRSRNHRRNIQNEDFRHVGFASAASRGGSRFWCAVYAC